MLKTFFEKDTDIDGKVTDNSHYFDGMKITGRERIIQSTWDSNR